MQFLPHFEFDYWTVLFFAFVGMVFVQFIYTLLIYGRLAFYKMKSGSEHLPELSVIIAARNEADNIYENLPYILDQNYPNFEVIVVVNQSTDESKHILQAYQQQYSNLRFTLVEKSKHLRPGKKLSVTLGIKAAKFEHLVFTDADCKPATKNWLREVASQFSEKSELVLGYGPYEVDKGFLNKLIRFDTAWIAINYFSFALARLPYMGVGRNLAYTKTLFEKANGFKSHYSIPSGDDDLFIQEAAKKKNYSIALHPDSFAYSEPEKTWDAWIRQKTRHHSTSDRYQVIKKALLGIYPLTLLLMYVFFVTLLFNDNFRWLTLAVFGIIFIVKWWIQGRCFYKINERSFVAFLPFSDLFYALFTPILYYSSESKTSNRW